jgi:acetoin utilization deacetylase AcuC-like enzyme
VTIPVFYSEKQTAVRNLSFSPSAEKPALVVAAWQQLGLPLEIIEPLPASLTDLCRAHDPSYVRGVLSGRLPNGFGNTLPEVNQTLPWTVGSVLCALHNSTVTSASGSARWPAGGWGTRSGGCALDR